MSWVIKFIKSPVNCGQISRKWSTREGLETECLALEVLLHTVSGQNWTGFRARQTPERNKSLLFSSGFFFQTQDPSE